MNRSHRLFTTVKFLLGFIAFLGASSLAKAQLSITCPADITVGNDVDQCSAIVNFTPPVGTGSGTGITTTLTQGLPSGSPFDVGVTEIIYTVTNNEGQSNSCTFLITVNDSQTPTYVCPPDIIINSDPGQCSAVVFFSIPPATDNCTLLNNVQTAGLPSGSTFPVGENNLTFRAIDISGNVAFCRIKVIVIDITVPNITCPADISLDVVSGCSRIVNYTAPVGSDACGPSITNLTSGLASGASFTVGITPVTYTVTDLAGNTASCTFNVTITDAIPPVLTCPGDLTINNPIPTACTAVVMLPQPSITDNCPGATVSQTGGLPSGGEFPAGTTIVTFTGTDAAGNSATCSYNVTVVESDPPTIICPADITISNEPGQCGATVTYPSPIGTDNCPGASTVIISGFGSGGFFPVGTSTETYEVTDAFGNTTPCSFLLTVVDSELPTLDCLPGVIANSDPGDCAAILNFAGASVFDNCPGVSVSQTGGLPIGGSFPVGTTFMEFTATDAAGNQALCSFEVEVVDAETPTITCPGDFSFSIPNSNCSAVVTYPDAVVTDNCPGATFIVTAGPASGSVLSAGVYTVTIEAEDAAGNTANCDFQITVTETSAPVINCPADLILPTDLGSCDAAVILPTPTATDSCSTSVTVSQTGGPLSGSTFPIGSTLVSFTATDPDGNNSSCSYNVIVVDQESPVFDCPGNINVANEVGSCSAVVTFSDPTATDNCNTVNVIQTAGPLSGSIFQLGSTPVTFTSTDDEGNTATCIFNVVVIDTEAPVITCPADFSFTIPDGDCSAIVNYPNSTITDNCPGTTFSTVAGPTSGSVVSAGIYTVTIQASDAAGNTSNCDFILTVNEASVPVIICPADLSVIASPGACEVAVTLIVPAASDSCSTVTIVQTEGPASGSLFPIGTTSVGFTATDLYGNSATCNYNVLVIDAVPPTIDCPAAISVNADAGFCGATVSYPIPDVNDNCGIASLTQTVGLGSGSVFPVGTTTESYEVVDLSGNVATCSFEVVVVDAEDPSITCPSDIILEIIDGTCETIVNFAPTTATDNCSIIAITQTAGPTSGSTLTVGNYTVSFTAIDQSGNSVDCSFSISVTESTAPQLNCPADIAVTNDAGQCGAIVSYQTPTATDNCPGVIAELSSGLPSAAFFPVGITPITYTATDASGNTASCTFNVTVADGEAPSVECPATITVSTDPGLCEATVVFPDPAASDNCPGGLTVTQILGPLSGSVLIVGSKTIEYEIVDGAGNTVLCSFEIIVEDNESPGITCPGDIVILTLGGACSSVVSFATPAATDNCGIASIVQTAGLTSGSAFPIGVNNVSFTATDENGNSTTCTFTISVSEDVAPTIICPADITVNTDQGICTAAVNYNLPTAADNCGNPTLALLEGLNTGASFPIGTTLVTYQAEDASGNTATCSFNVTVIDNQGPVFTNCPSSATIEAPESLCGAVYTFDPLLAFDNCDGAVSVVQTLGPNSGATLPLGETAFGFTVTDATGITSTCNFTITVIDDLPPMFANCPPNLEFTAIEGGCSAVVDFEIPLAIDNCSAIASQISGPISGSELPVGTYTLTFEAVDPSGNTSTCETQLVVVDQQAPVISCPASFETCETNPIFELPDAVDNCGIASVLQTAGPTSGSLFIVGDNVLSFEATDLAGNSISCLYTITVLQNAPQADAGPDQNICDETETTLQGSNPEFASGTWTQIAGSMANLSDSNIPNTALSNLTSGTNTFVWSIDPGNGCAVTSDTVNVIVEPGVAIEAGPDRLINFGGSVQIITAFSPSDGSFIWQPETGLSCVTCANPVASPSENTLYTVSFTTDLGCIKTDSVLVRVFREIPNTITPDGDGVNDVWNIPGIENYPLAQVWIYNRWGGEVFNSDGYREPWNGKHEDKELPTGSYYYLVKYNTAGIENLNGTVNIIR